MDNNTSYCTRKWLNPPTSPSTGSVVCFDGITEYSDGIERNTFIEIASCRTKVRLHKTFSDDIGDFINKLRDLQTEIGAFIEHLEKEQTSKPNSDKTTK